MTGLCGLAICPSQCWRLPALSLSRTLRRASAPRGSRASDTRRLRVRNCPRRPRDLAGSSTTKRLKIGWGKGTKEQDGGWVAHIGEEYPATIPTKPATTAKAFDLS